MGQKMQSPKMQQLILSRSDLDILHTFAGYLIRLGQVAALCFHYVLQCLIFTLSERFPSTQQVDWLQGIKLRRILIWTVVGCQQKPAHRVTGSVRWSTYCLKISKIAKDILSK